MTILLLRDLLDIKARKQRELAFYTDKKTELETTLCLIRRELNLTDRILRMIKAEELQEINDGRHPKI